jgi:predicted Zn-dependent peptidase
MGRYEILGLGYQYLFEYPKVIDNVKVEDILKAAGKYLKSYTLSAIVPKK